VKALFYFAPLFMRVRGPLLVTVLLSLISLAAGVGLLGISGWFLTAAALSTAGVTFNLFAPSAGVRGLSFVRILSRYGEKLTGHDATLRVLSDLRRVTFAGLFRLVPLGRRFGRADLVTRLVSDLDALDTLFLVGLGPITTALLAGIAMSVALALALPAAAGVYAAGFAIATLGVPTLLITASRDPARRAAVAQANLRGAILDGIDGHQDLVVFGELGSAEASIMEASAQLANARKRLALYGSLASAAVQSTAAVILVATLASGLEAIHKGAIDGAVFVGLLLAVTASFEACAMLVRSATRLAGAAAAAERLAAIATSTADVLDPASATPLPAAGSIAFDSVCFGYGGRVNVLDGLSLSVAPGECVAIKGRSGSGKSTIAQLAVRLIEPLSGSVRFGGVDIAAASLHDLHERVVLMTQDAPVFNDTIAANLRIGRENASDAELWEVLKHVQLEAAIRELPDGIETVLGEGGKTLSAGQARRISLARTLLSPARILILDEPTNGLDAETEAAFLGDLPALAAGRTMIVITHAELPADFGRVLELRGGRIAA